MGIIHRGDLVIVSLQGDYGKPRPALVVQSELLSDLESLILCPITSDIKDAATFRITIEPNLGNGLKKLSQVMVDKISTVHRNKVSEAFGQIEEERMHAVERALLLVLGFA